MSNILTRTIWGAFFIVIIIGSFLVGRYTTAITLGVFMIIGVYEFYQLFKASEEEIRPMKIIGILAALILYSSLVIQKLELLHFDLILVFIPIVFLPTLNVIFSRSKNPLLDLTVTFFPWLYYVFSTYLMVSILVHQGGSQYPWVFISGLFLLVWTNDTFAYLAGRAFGKHRLFERISPKKSWEGAIGGFLFTLIFAFLFAFFTNKEYVFWIVAAVVISPTSILGDLIESKMKRLVNVKDSGKILPGHGGILDRFDAVTYAVPFFYLLLILFF